jgi:hypothetical protein
VLTITAFAHRLAEHLVGLFRKRDPALGAAAGD